MRFWGQRPMAHGRDGFRPDRSWSRCWLAFKVSQPRSGDRASQGLMESVRPYRGCGVRPYRLSRRVTIFHRIAHFGSSPLPNAHFGNFGLSARPPFSLSLWGLHWIAPRPYAVVEVLGAEQVAPFLKRAPGQWRSRLRPPPPLCSALGPIPPCPQPMSTISTRRA